MNKGYFRQNKGIFRGFFTWLACNGQSQIIFLVLEGQFMRFWIIFIAFLGFAAHAQNLPLGTWTAHLPLQNAVGIAQSGENIYGAAEYGVFSVNIGNGFIEKYTKSNGLSEVPVKAVGYDMATSTLLIAYKNSNIDLIQNGKVINLPFLKTATVSGDKGIYCIFTANQKAYLGIGFGIMEIDLERQEIRETYNFNDGINDIRVNAIWADASNIFAATSNGVYRGAISNSVNLLNFNNWEHYTSGIPTTEATAISEYNGNVIAASGSTLYSFDGSNWSVFFTDPNWITFSLNDNNSGLQIAQQKIVANNVVDKRIGRWNGSSFTFLTNFNIERPLQVLEDRDGVLWHADLFRGIVKDNASFESIVPNGPFAITNREMAYLNGTMYVTSSDITNSWFPVGNRNGFYACNNYNWTNYTIYNTPFLDSLQDIAVIEAIPAEGKIIMGAHYTGIIEFKPSDNSVLVNAFRLNNGGKFRITGADIDALGNVWLSDAYASYPIVCRKADGTYKYFQSGLMNGDLVKDILADDFGNVFVAKEAGDGGLVVFNYGADIDDASDDRYVNLSAGAGLGNLPANNVICLAKDNDGTIWLGTSQGIAIIPCPALVIDLQCEAEQICVDRGDGSGFCDNLLEDENVNCITVDAANRKWIGTNNGLFLVSADGQKTLYKFTVENSPLLANAIRSVEINPDNGDVFIGTASGINTFRGEAAPTSDNNNEVFVYPNPVYHDYRGLIAIKGLPNNSPVKITDAAGNLVFQTTSLGGQAVWDGSLSNGDRAASGVYIVLSVSSDKKEKVATKFVLLH